MGGIKPLENWWVHHTKAKKGKLLRSWSLSKPDRINVNRYTLSITHQNKQGNKELKGLVSSINYESRTTKVSHVTPINLNILSRNVRGLNESDKRLRIRNLHKL